MSTDATQWAWNVRGLKASDKLVLLALADRAGEDHTAWPSIERLVLDTELNRKTVQAALKRLISSGHVADTGRTAGKSSRVRVLQLVGVVGREDKQAQKGDDPKTGTVPNLGPSQKRDDTDNGMIPVLPGDDPENGLGDDPKNGIQNLKEEPIKEPTTGSAAPDASAEPPLLRLPMNVTNKTGEEYAISRAFAAEMAELYPGVDIDAAFRRMRSWLLTNPTKRKTEGGMPAFIDRWLAKAQNKGEFPRHGGGTGKEPALFRWTSTTMLTDANTAKEIGDSLRQGCPWARIPPAHQQRLVALWREGRLPYDLVQILIQQGITPDRGGEAA